MTQSSGTMATAQSAAGTEPPPEWSIDPHRRELRYRGALVPLGVRAFEIVEVLVAAGGALVTKSDLMDRIWPGACVGDNTLQVQISAIRKALGVHRALLTTASGRGYRLLGDWTIRQEFAASARPRARAARSLPLAPLPAASGDLVGRAGAIEQLSELLSAFRVVTLTGPGGIGKTRLALEIAHRVCRDNGCDGAIAELVSLADPDLLPSAVGSALGFTAGPDAASAATVGMAIGDRPLLLLLDNCEHVIDAAARFAETVVRLCPLTTVLTTSREPLRIDGEYAYQVRPLAVPEQKSLRPDEILDYAAVQLFVARTRASGGYLAPLTERDLSEIVAVCTRLDGMPLAIELAAARTATLGLTEVLGRLDDRFTLLTSGRRTALPRHKTLRATLDWSYELLPRDEQALLRRLSVFVASFTAEAAAAVSDPGETAEQQIVAGIAGLVDKSLVHLDRTNAPTRWKLLETTRVYALEKLKGHGEFDGCARRLAEYYVRFLSSLNRERSWHLTPAQISLFQPDADNIRAALDWAFLPRGAVAIGVALTTAAVPLWLGLSLVVECREHVERALDNLAPDTRLDQRARLRLHATLGMTLLSTTGLYRESEFVLRETLAIATDLEDVDHQLQALWALWTYSVYTGENRVAESIGETFCQLAPRAANQADVYVGERLMGVTMHYRGHQPEARSRLENVLRHYVAPDDGQHLLRFQYDQSILARSIFSRVLWIQGRCDQALRSAQASVAEGQSSRHVVSLCYALAMAACPIALMTGSLDYAEQSVALLVSLATKHRLEYWGGWGRSFEGTMTILRGDAGSGLRTLRSALDAFRSAGWAMRFPAFLCALSHNLAKTGQASAAVAMLDEALAQSERDGEMWCYAELWRGKGEILLLSGARSAAETATDCFLAAIDAARSQDALFWELRATMSLVRVRRDRVAHDDGRPMLRAVYDRFTEGFGTADLAAARVMLADHAGS